MAEIMAKIMVEKIEANVRISYSYSSYIEHTITVGSEQLWINNSTINDIEFLGDTNLLKRITFSSILFSSVDSISKFLNKCTVLDSICFINSDLDSDIIRIILESLPPSVKKLSLLNQYSEIEIPTNLKQQLESLSLDDSVVGDIVGLCNFLHNNDQLVTLTLKSCRLCKESLAEILLVIPTCTSLKTLDVRDNRLSNYKNSVFKLFAELDNIECLLLTVDRVDDEIEPLATLISRNSNLREIIFRIRYCSLRPIDYNPVRVALENNYILTKLEILNDPQIAQLIRRNIRLQEYRRFIKTKPPA